MPYANSASKKAKASRSETNRKYYAANRAHLMSKQPEQHLKRKYGLTMEQYLGMKDDQQGCCALCDRRRVLVVDHDHSTGKVRKLLCYGCNMTLGGIETSGGLLFLQKAAAYLRSGK